MPRKKSVNSLADVCYKNIARNMDSYWLSDLDSDFGENPYLLYIVGPFDHLTECQIQELIYMLSSLKLLKRRHLQILINARLKSLDLSKSSVVANNGLILKSIAFRCQNLTSLNIKGCNFITPKVIAESIRNLPLIKHLQLSRTKTNDMVLSVIGDYCSFLLSLDVSCCVVVSNKGADNLCQTYSKDGPKCLSLQKLNIQATYINIKGAESIIQTFKDLCVFDFCGSFEAVISVVQSVDNDVVFKLTKLSSMQNDLTAEDFKIVVKSCPFVSALSFNCDGTIKIENLLLLKDLNWLQSLDVCNISNKILPLIKVKGDNLTSLCLEFVEDVNAETLGKYCPNLVDLYIGMLLSPTSANRTTQNIYKKLETLTIIVENDSDMFNPIDLSTILENATNLKKVKFLNVQSFTDNLLNQTLIFNPLRRLEEISLEDCHAFTEKLFWQLVTGENDLKKIILTQCMEITRNNFESFKNYIDQKCLDLIVSYD